MPSILASALIRKLEPVALVWAYFIVLADPFRFYADQAPNRPLTIEKFQPQAQALTFQMGNVLLLLAAMALICCWTKHTEIAFWYLVAVAIADVGHIIGSWKGVGSEYFLNVAAWDDMFIGNVGVSAFLHVNRWMTVLSVFGRLQGEAGNRKSKGT